MVLHRTLDYQYNHESVNRIMRKYGLLSSVRRANPYRKIIEDRIHPNRVKRQFKINNPGNVLLTDITYLQYGKTQTAYLSTILDAATNEVIAYQLRAHLKIDLVLETLEHLTFHSNIQLAKQTVIHSDQGSHYTNPKFSEKIKQLKIKQSMSPKGNCWDNAPQESFFGYLKDEINLKEPMTLEELSKEIDDYIYYYNHYRHQWNLKKMIPVEYRNHLLTA